MDNINVIRVGFFAPQTVLNDTDMNAGDPLIRGTTAYTCLVFANPDNKCIGIIKDLEREFASPKSSVNWRLSVVLPLKPTSAQQFKNTNVITARLFCDSELNAGKSYSIVDTRTDAPTYHPTIFFVGDEGTVHQRYNIDNEGFNLANFRDIIAKII